jgi:hypothetical protein
MTRSSRSTDYSTRIAVPQEEYEWLDAVRDNLGLTWRGMMLKAEQRLLAAERTWPPKHRTQRVVPKDANAENETEAGKEGEESNGEIGTEEATG